MSEGKHGKRPPLYTLRDRNWIGREDAIAAELSNELGVEVAVIPERQFSFDGYKRTLLWEQPERYRINMISGMYISSEIVFLWEEPTSVLRRLAIAASIVKSKNMNRAATIERAIALGHLK